MKRIRRCVLMGCLLIACSVLGNAQQDRALKSGEPNAGVKYFHLDFVVKEVEDGHVLNSRNYAITVNTETGLRPPSIRAGNKFAVPTSGAEYQNYEEGVNIDCRDIQLAGTNLQLGITAEVNSFVSVPRDGSNSNAYPRPVVRSNRWSSSVSIPLRKPTTVFSSDDVSSKRKLQLEVTATPIL